MEELLFIKRINRNIKKEKLLHFMSYGPWRRKKVDKEEVNMEYREIGNTGKRSSIIGLGCENLDGKPFKQIQETIDAAIENGINLFDVFMPGNEIRENIAKAIGSRREKVMIQGHIGSTDIKQQYDISRDLPVVKQYFENLLRIFGYIDFGMMFFIDSEEDYQGVFETGFVDYVQKLKEQGYIKHIGFSSHNPNMAMRVINTGLPETVSIAAIAIPVRLESILRQSINT